MSVVVTPDQIAERHRLGLDRFDEIWQGRYHVNAAPHPRHSFLLRHAERLLDERAEAQGLVPLGEVLIIDLDARTVTWLALDELRTVYATAERSALLRLSADDVSAHLPWNLIDS